MSWLFFLGSGGGGAGGGDGKSGLLVETFAEGGGGGGGGTRVSSIVEIIFGGGGGGIFVFWEKTDAEIKRATAKVDRLKNNFLIKKFSLRCAQTRFPQFFFKKNDLM